MGGVFYAGRQPTLGDHCFFSEADNQHIPPVSVVYSYSNWNQSNMIKLIIICLYRYMISFDTAH